MTFITTFFFFTISATSEIYTLSLHDALPICLDQMAIELQNSPGSTGYIIAYAGRRSRAGEAERMGKRDRKSTRLNSSHRCISYAVFCLKKKKKKKHNMVTELIS